MSSLIENARKLMDAAVDAGEAGGDSDWTVYFGPDGGLEMIAGCDTPLESLTWSRGARAAWQVRHHADGIRVDGRDARERCSLESVSSAAVVRNLLGSSCLYQLVPAR